MDDSRPTSFEKWQSEIPDLLRCDPLWTYVAYPKALFLFDLAWFDCERLLKDARGRILVSQLTDAASSISANIEEGYGKGFGADYARFLQIALGSARETRGWYWRARKLLPSQVVEHRMSLTTEIIRLLKTTIPQQRAIKRKK
jgi:four helix bundle protein